MKGRCSAALPKFSLSAHFHPLPLLYSLTSGSWPPRVLCPLPMWTRYLAVSLQLADVCSKYFMNKSYDYGASTLKHSKEKLFFAVCMPQLVMFLGSGSARFFAQEMLKIFIIAASAWRILV